MDSRLAGAMCLLRKGRWLHADEMEFILASLQPINIQDERCHPAAAREGLRRLWMLSSGVCICALCIVFGVCTVRCWSQRLWEKLRAKVACVYFYTSAYHPKRGVTNKLGYFSFSYILNISSSSVVCWSRGLLFPHADHKSPHTKWSYSYGNIRCNSLRNVSFMTFFSVSVCKHNAKSVLPLTAPRVVPCLLINATCGNPCHLNA